jgi:hypothetical protein
VSAYDVLALFSLAMGLASGVGSVRAWRGLRRTERLLAEYRRDFTREVVREWASKMPRTGSIATDRFAPEDTVYILRPDMVRRTPSDDNQGGEA